MRQIKRQTLLRKHVLKTNQYLKLEASDTHKKGTNQKTRSICNETFLSENHLCSDTKDQRKQELICTILSPNRHPSVHFALILIHDQHRKKAVITECQPTPQKLVTPFTKGCFISRLHEGLFYLTPSRLAPSSRPGFDGPDLNE